MPSPQAVQRDPLRFPELPPTAGYEHLQALLESAAEGIYGVDQNGRCSFINSSACESLGYAREEVLGRDMHALIHGKHPDGSPYPARECPLLNAIKGEESIRLADEQLWRKDGGSFSAELSRAPILSRGKLLGFVVTFTNITGRKQAEQAIREREERYRSLVQATASIVWNTTALGEFNAPQHEWSAFTGQTFEQYRGRGWLQAVHPEDRDETLRAWRRCAAERTVCTVEQRLRRRDGEYRDMQVRAVPVFSPDGSVREWVGVDTDVTERRRAEQQTSESEERFRFLAESIPHLVWAGDAAGELDYVNHRILDYTGARDVEEMRRATWMSFVHPEDHEHALTAWRQAEQNGEEYRQEYRLRDRAGEYRWFYAHALPLHGGDGKVLRWFGTGTDIDERKKSEDAMRKAEKLAAVGRMAASIAHEINNPLEAVTNLLYLLHHADLPPPQAHLVEMAQQELARVAEITKQTLRFHRQSTRPTKAFAPEIIESVLTLHGGKVTAAHIALERDYTQAEPIICYEGEIRQVLANLIGNAIDALANAPQPRLKIRVRQMQEAKGRRNGISVSIADNGAGIQPEARTRIFEPFYTTKGLTGTGLGLWVSREIVEKHGGSIRVRTSTAPQRHGTVFNVWLTADPRFKK